MGNDQRVHAPLIELAVKLSGVFRGLITVCRQFGAGYAGGAFRLLTQLAHEACERPIIGSIFQIQPLQHTQSSRPTTATTQCVAGRPGCTNSAGG